MYLTDRKADAERFTDLRVEQHGELIKNGFPRLFKRILGFSPDVDSNLLIIRLTSLAGLGDENLVAHPELNDEIEVFGGTLSRHTKVLGVQCLLPGDCDATLSALPTVQIRLEDTSVNTSTHSAVTPEHVACALQLMRGLRYSFESKLNSDLVWKNPIRTERDIWVI